MQRANKLSQGCPTTLIAGPVFVRKRWDAVTEVTTLGPQPSQMTARANKLNECRCQRIPFAEKCSTLSKQKGCNGPATLIIADVEGYTPPKTVRPSKTKTMQWARKQMNTDFGCHANCTSPLQGSRACTPGIQGAKGGTVRAWCVSCFFRELGGAPPPRPPREPTCSLKGLGKKKKKCGKMDKAQPTRQRPQRDATEERNTNQTGQDHRACFP